MHMGRMSARVCMRKLYSVRADMGNIPYGEAV